MLPVLAIFLFWLGTFEFAPSLSFSPDGSACVYVSLGFLGRHAHHVARLESSNFCHLELQNILPDSGPSTWFRHQQDF